MSDKVLLVASVASMIQQFNMRNIDILLQMVYQVEVACNFAEGNTCAPEQIGELKKELEEGTLVEVPVGFSFPPREIGFVCRQKDANLDLIVPFFGDGQGN